MPRIMNPFSYLPRRLQIVASLTLFLLFCILFFGSSTSDSIDPYIKSVPGGQAFHDSAHQAVDEVHEAFDRLPHALPHINTPTWLNWKPSHKPPEQANSTSGETKWFSDWSWRNPFSSSTTLDEERAVLPPLSERPPVYTYWNDTSEGKSTTWKNAEQELLTVWRRAWWAQGFKPVVLGAPEAMNNPLWRSLQGLNLDPQLEAEMMKWLAWGNMGTGIMCNWLTLPMAKYDDPLLSFLRRGEYPALTRYKYLDTGMYVGSKYDVDRTLKASIAYPQIKEVKSIVDAVPSDFFKVDYKHDGVAFYSGTVVKKEYKAIAEKLNNITTYGEGLAMLPHLINSHLHNAWQSSFSKGISVMKPLPDHTTNLIKPAMDLARNLSQCPYTPIPSSCPPNNLGYCKPCVASHPMKITNLPTFRNTTELFTIATVPHPYTIASLEKQQDNFNVRFVRRETGRDVWIMAATKELSGTGISASARLPQLKSAIASDATQAHTLWLTAERPPDPTSEHDLDELDWTFGFRLPRSAPSDGKSETPVPGPERRPPPPKPEYGQKPLPQDVELEQEKALLLKARMAIDNGRKNGGVKAHQAIRSMVEAWSLADTEIWKFVRAFNARRRIERRKWEEDEEAFIGKGMFDRWMDKIA